MILLDTNVLIYLRNGQLDDNIVQSLRTMKLDTCNVIIAEILSYPLTEINNAKFFNLLFATMHNYSFDSAVTVKAIELKRATSIRLPDAIIAATALVHDLELWTHNTSDFKNIPNLKLFDPIKS